jgi:hypothetical protein
LHVEHRRDGVTSAWSQGELVLERNDAIFGAFAGVGGTTAPLFAPRGLPSDLSPEVFERYYAFIIDPAEAESWSGFYWMSKTHAASLLQSGQSHAPPPSYTKCNMTSPLGYVSIPGLHTPSWLTHDEVLRALEHVHVEVRAAWAVLLDLLASIEQRLPGAQSRIVFWFS